MLSGDVAEGKVERASYQESPASTCRPSVKLRVAAVMAEIEHVQVSAGVSRGNVDSKTHLLPRESTECEGQ